jgi:diacylglycerol kinase (ATP)
MSSIAAKERSTFVIFNPGAGRGRGARLVGPLLQALAGLPVEHALTSAPGHEADLAQAAAERGFAQVVAVGGDGTWGNAANGLLRAGRRARLGLVAGGTGCDFAKTLGVPARDLAAAASVVRQGQARAVDVGRIEGRHFLNIAGFGYDVAVLEDSKSVRWLRGDLLYPYCALRQLRRYHGFRCRLAVDDGPGQEQDLLMLILANARIFGGTFRIAPQADLADGRLDAVAFGNASTLGRLGLMRRLLAGTHLEAAQVTLRRATRLRLAFDEPPAYETDGEWNRAREADILVETLPGALEVLVPGLAA